MSEPILGTLEVKDTAGANIRVTINGDDADITAGGKGQDGDLVLRDASDKERIRIGHIKEFLASPGAPQPTLVADYWGVVVRTSQGQKKLIQLGAMGPQSGTPQIAAPQVTAIVGDDDLAGSLTVKKGQGNVNAASFDKHGAKLNGNLEIKNGNGKVIVIVDSEAAQFILQGADGKPIMSVDGIQLKLGDGQVALSNVSGGAALGGYGKFGALLLRDKDNNDIIVLDGGAANLRLGGNNTAGGDIALFPKNAAAEDLKSFTKAIIHLDGNAGNIFLRQDGKNRVTLDAVNGNLHVGGNGAKGDLFLYPDSVADPFNNNTDGNNASIHLDGSANGRIIVRKLVEAPPDNPFGIFYQDAIVVDGNTGDITLANGDCAEDFEVVNFDEATPGTVMVMQDAERLRPSNHAYDKKVAGIVSGAGKGAGIVLGREPGTTRRRPIALAGRVNCKVDAQYGAVEVGDLLTTSWTPGHAMKVLDERAAFGAVIGKALAPLVKGQKLLPVLVALQ
jgi:hypothetical protein